MCSLPVVGGCEVDSGSCEVDSGSCEFLGPLIDGAQEVVEGFVELLLSLLLDRYAEGHDESILIRCDLVVGLKLDFVEIS